MKKNNGVTLIALIITIIVLLILAGVTLSMVMGESGIFNKAKLAKSKNNIAAIEEIIKMDKLENDINKKTGDNYLEDNELIDKIKEELEEKGYDVKDDNSIEVDGEKIKIEDYLTQDDDISDEQKKEEINAKDIQQHPEWYYGKTVTSYVSKNNISDWKIFYSDGSHIFLIKSDYLENTKLDNLDSTKLFSPEALGKYVALWSYSSGQIPEKQNISDSDLNLYYGGNYTKRNSNENTCCVAALLNTENWESFKDEKGQALSAIGSPTLEMFQKSWNNLYEDKIYIGDASETGYAIGNVIGQANNFVFAGKNGSDNKLYFPRDAVADGCVGYWLASNAINDGQNGNCLFTIICTSDQPGLAANLFSSPLSLRPVVCLNINQNVAIE